MTIHDPVAYCNGLWDWAILDGCFGETRIKPTDVDGLIERNKKFLVLEAKSPGVEIPCGQMIMFKNMIATGVFSIIVIWGERNRPQLAQIMTHSGIKEPKPCDIEQLRTWVKSWFTWADSL